MMAYLKFGKSTPVHFSLSTLSLLSVGLDNFSLPELVGMVVVVVVVVQSGAPALDLHEIREAPMYVPSPGFI
jgi:hypothetical protein